MATHRRPCSARGDIRRARWVCGRLAGVRFKAGGHSFRRTAGKLRAGQGVVLQVFQGLGAASAVMENPMASILRAGPDNPGLTMLAAAERKEEGFAPA